MLFLSALLILVRLFIVKETQEDSGQQSNLNIWVKAVVLGVIAGILSGTFGIGSAPFIQIGLMILLRLSIRQSVGTTMLVIIPLAVGGGLGYVTEGFVDYMLLVKVLIGTMCGAYVGAKFTNLVPKVILKSAIFLTPAIAGLMLYFKLKREAAASRFVLFFICFRRAFSALLPFRYDLPAYTHCNADHCCPEPEMKSG